MSANILPVSANPIPKLGITKTILPVSANPIPKLGITKTLTLASIRLAAASPTTGRIFPRASR